jgi:diacylglycerol kinase
LKLLLISPAHTNIHWQKLGKDVGAAAVLVAAISSVIIGFLILGPPLLEKAQTVDNSIKQR